VCVYVCHYLSLSSRENDRDGGVLRVKLQTAADDGIVLLYIKYSNIHRTAGRARSTDSSEADRWNRRSYSLRRRRHCFIITILTLVVLRTGIYVYILGQSIMI